MIKSSLRLLLSAGVILMLALSCGGTSQAPAETPAGPSMEPDAHGPPDATDAGMPEGEHTMPDGSTMPGHEHKH
jgi:hypothetical protein